MTASAVPSRLVPSRPAPVRPGPAGQRNGLGLSALVLGIAGIPLGAFAGITWFVALPLGLLTVVLGVSGLTQKRYHLASDATTAVIGTIAGAITLALGVWGTGNVLNELHQTATAGSTGQVTTARWTGTRTGTGDTAAGSAAAVGSAAVGSSWSVDGVPAGTWGRPHAVGDHLVVTVSAPVTFRSRGDAGAVRSVVLGVTVTNDGTSAYRVSTPDFQPSATLDGRPLSQVATPDGTVDRPSTTIRPGRSFGYRVAYALSAPTGDLRLAFRPSPDSPVAVVAGPA
jgi:hypothetical protein